MPRWLLPWIACGVAAAWTPAPAPAAAPRQVSAGAGIAGAGAATAGAAPAAGVAASGAARGDSVPGDEDTAGAPAVDADVGSAAAAAVDAAVGAALDAVAARTGAIADPAAQSVVMFSPQGLTPQVRQVVARFATPMVPLGDPRVDAAVFAIDCAVPGRARWVSEREWAYDFVRDLPPDTACRFELGGGVRDATGRPLSGRRVFAFHTGHPVVTVLRPWPGSRIDADQRFALRFSGRPDGAALARHAHVRVAGLAEPVALRIVDDADAAAALRHLPAGDGGDDGGDDAGDGVVLEPVLQLPAAARVELVVTTSRDLPGQSFPYQTRAPLGVDVRCQRVNADAGCIPLTTVRVDFTAPVSVAAMARARLVPMAAPRTGADAARNPGTGSAAPAAPASDPAARNLEPDGDHDRSDFRSGYVVRGPFAPGSRYRLELPADLRDEAGRALADVDPRRLELVFDAMPPLAKFAADFGIVEAAEPLLPVTVRGIEPEAMPQGASLSYSLATASAPGPAPARIWSWLRALQAQRGGTAGDSLLARLPGAPPAAARPLPAVAPAGGARAETSDVVGIPLPGKGLHVVEVGSRVLGAALLGAERTYHAASMVLVTDLAVHLKTAHDGGALAWVTRLSDGRPVPAAGVVASVCSGMVMARATTDADGIARLDLPPAAPRCDGYRAYDGGFLVTAQAGDDVGFVHTSWDRGIETWRFGVPTGWQPPQPVAHTVLARSLLRAGETVHMKHFLRQPVREGLQLSPGGKSWPPLLRIRHDGSDDVFEVPLSFAGDGTATSEWPIPATARLGRYRLWLQWGEDELEAGSFRVEAFRLPLLRGGVDVPAHVLAGQPFPLAVTLAYASGGAAAGLPVEVRTQVVPAPPPAVAGFEGYAFMLGDVREGVVRLGDADEGGGRSGDAAGGVARAVPLALDAAGSGSLLVDAPATGEGPRVLQAEVSFRDPNGEVQTLSRSVPVHAARRLVGLRLGEPVSSGTPLHVDVALVDLAHRGVRGRVSVDLLERRTYSTRRRLAGGFYAYEHAIETTRLLTLCEGSTDRGGRLACVLPGLTGGGDRIVRAVAVDEDGRRAVTHASFWLPGADDDWYAAADSDRMDLLPEATRVEPGDTARLRVRMPFREASALVTVEREGIIDAFVQRLSGRDPRIRVPIRDAHAPNVFVSVLAVRGRIDAPRPTALVDLAKPAAKLGITSLAVGLEPRTLHVDVRPAQDAYAVRQRAAATIRVRTPEGGPPPPGSEVAVAVVDEALLELAPNASWSLLEAMHGSRPLDVRTFTAQQQVVGRRHYGSKARPAGGGGGVAPTRELFDTLLAWQPRVQLDAHGEARVDFALNDALTAFRVAAIASAGSERFGSGFASVRTTQDLMLLPGVAPVARSGDRVRAEFTARNTTQRSLDVTATLAVTGVDAAFPPQQFALAAGEARVVAWPLVVPAAGEIAYEAALTATAAADAAPPSDRVRVRQLVAPAVPERVVQAVLQGVDGSVRQRLQRPAGALAGAGGVEVALLPSLAADTGGIERFLAAYPYTCMEQAVSTAVGLADAARWQDVVQRLPAHLDGDGLVRFWPGDGLDGSDVLSAYVVSVADAAGFTIPAASLERMLAGLQAFADGRIRRGSWLAAADLPLRRLAALAALARHGRVDAAVLGTLPADASALPTSGLLDYLDLLSRLPGAADAAARRDDIERVLRARLVLGGTTLGFATETADTMDWMLATAETNLLRFVLHAADSPAFAADAPRLLRGALSRQRSGAFSTTIGNAWGRLALRRFERLEAVPVAGTTTLRATPLPDDGTGAQAAANPAASPRGAATAAGDVRTVTWQPATVPETQRFPWPDGAFDLHVEHAGAGRPWLVLRSVAALPPVPVSAGYALERTWQPVVQKTPGAWSRGDVVRVRLVIDAQVDFSWVVVEDPIPAGATILGSGLGRDSALLAAGERDDAGGWWCPCRAFTERTPLAFRDYYQYVPKGRFTVEYTLRLNQDGEFQVPPTHVEAMYAPESFADLPHDVLRVLP